MDFLIKKLISITGYDLEKMLNDLQIGLKDRVVVLLGETGAGKSTFINSITNSNECKTSPNSKACTHQIQIVKYFYDGYNIFFVDTPGLNDARGDLNNIEQIQKIQNKHIISTIILVNNYNIVRLTNSYKEILKTFMNIFPSEDFFEHLIYVETNFFVHKEKDSLIESIKDNDELIDFINSKNINIPEEIKTYPIDLLKSYETNETTFKNILNDIKEMYPLYRSTNVKNEISIKPITNNEGKKLLEYQYIKNITHIDFDGNEINKKDVVDRGYFAEDSKAPEQIIVEREKTDELRKRKCFCCFTYYEYLVYYWEIKKYIINGNIYDLKAKIEEGWENSDKDGEKHRKEMEISLNHNIKLKI